MDKCVIKKVDGLEVDFEANGEVVTATANHVYVKGDVEPFVGCEAFVNFKLLNGKWFFNKCVIDLSKAKDVSPFGKGKEVDF